MEEGVWVLEVWLVEGVAVAMCHSWPANLVLTPPLVARVISGPPTEVTLTISCPLTAEKKKKKKLRLLKTTLRMIKRTETYWQW